MTNLHPIDWIPEHTDDLMPGRLRILDQTRLPTETVYIDTTEQNTVWQAIRDLQVRGAPAIGVAAAMGVAAAAQEKRGGPVKEVILAVDAAATYLSTSRPTAVNLFWAIDRMRRKAHASTASSGEALARELIEEALAIRDEDLAMCRAIGEHGAALLKDGDTVLTHCNAGGLATSGYGTALAPIYVAQTQGKHIAVYADETRPLLQGARLTTWELMQAGIDVTLICDNVAAQVMKEGRITMVMVGADRIAANGDAANKIGTYGVALLAKAHHLPFYVLAPTSTIDPEAATGAAIPIEERGANEVTHGFGTRTAPEGVSVYAPAFDVTPAHLITGIITENGILEPGNLLDQTEL